MIERLIKLTNKIIYLFFDKIFLNPRSLLKSANLKQKIKKCSLLYFPSFSRLYFGCKSPNGMIIGQNAP